jgi:glycosyltransferase involved in cell wall biosynthesis
MLHHDAWAVDGQGVQHALLSRHLARQGLSVTSLVGGVGRNALELPDGGAPGRRWFTPRPAATWKALAQADADVYYTSCSGPMAGLLAWFCQRHRRRFVLRIGSVADCAPSTLLSGKLLYGYGLRRANVVLVQTAGQATLLRRHHGVQPRLAGMFSELPATVSGFDQRGADLLWLARLRAIERPDWLLDIARQVPRLRCRLAATGLAGDGALYRRVADAAAALPNLAFHDQPGFAAAAALFATTRLFINTSAAEDFPGAYLQAWANGVPVIAAVDPDGLIVRHGLGMLADSPAMAGARARALLAAPASWAACSARCRRYAATRLAPDTVARPYLAALAPI